MKPLSLNQYLSILKYVDLPCLPVVLGVTARFSAESTPKLPLSTFSDSLLLLTKRTMNPLELTFATSSALLCRLPLWLCWSLLHQLKIKVCELALCRCSIDVVEAFVLLPMWYPSEDNLLTPLVSLHSLVPVVVCVCGGGGDCTAIEA